MRIPRPPRGIRLLAAAALTAPLAACGGPSGVDLGDDWAGSEVFVLAKVGGLTTVVGIDPALGKAESLAAVPTRDDDDTVVSPRITQLADKRWMVTVPAKSGRPSTLYEVNTKDHALDRIGTVENGRVLIPSGGQVAAVGSSVSGAGKADALVYDPAGWTVQRTATLPFDAKLAAGGTGGLCSAETTGDRSRVALIPLNGGTAHTLSPLGGFSAQSLTCADGTPVLAAGPANGMTPGTPTLSLAHRDGTDVVTSSLGRIDRVAADSSVVTAAVVLPDHVELVQLDRKDGRELKRTRIDGMGAVDGLRPSSRGWVLTSGDASAVTGDAPKAVAITLPGRILDAG
ncbi:hypothetical protein ACGF12_34275 [Kitasatospora sp. NPDC048296]|uniref:hypothetical protein n=1 Tax=Kitasatospora sp. NPDC048296 TaxID=3364048 RepID=UPI0037169C7A